MGNAGTRFSQERDLRIVHMNAMSKNDVGCSQTCAGKILDVTLAGLLLDEPDLVTILRSVCMDQNTVLARKSGDFVKQTFCTTEGEARRKTTSDPSIIVAIPALYKINRGSN